MAREEILKHVNFVCDGDNFWCQQYSPNFTLLSGSGIAQFFQMGIRIQWNLNEKYLSRPTIIITSSGSGGLLLFLFLCVPMKRKLRWPRMLLGHLSNSWVRWRCSILLKYKFLFSAFRVFSIIIFKARSMVFCSKSRYTCHLSNYQEEKNPTTESPTILDQTVNFQFNYDFAKLQTPVKIVFIQFLQKFKTDGTLALFQYSRTYARGIS